GGRGSIPVQAGGVIRVRVRASDFRFPVFPGSQAGLIPEAEGASQAGLRCRFNSILAVDATLGSGTRTPSIWTFSTHSRTPAAERLGLFPADRRKTAATKFKMR